MDSLLLGYDSLSHTCYSLDQLFPATEVFPDQDFPLGCDAGIEGIQQLLGVEFMILALWLLGLCRVWRWERPLRVEEKQSITGQEWVEGNRTRACFPCLQVM